MAATSLRSLAQELLAAGSEDERVYLLNSRYKLFLQEAPWEDVKDSGITDAFLDVTVTPMTVSLVSQVAVAERSCVFTDFP